MVRISQMRASGEQVVISAAEDAATTAEQVSPQQRKGSAREALKAAESGLSPRELRQQRNSATLAVAEVPAVPAAEEGAETVAEEAATAKPQPFRMSASPLSFLPKLKGGFWSRRGWQSGARPASAKRGSKQPGAPASAKELQRRAEFCQAVRAYEWKEAEALAATEQEEVDVADSKNRVEWMEYFLAQGDGMQAMLYAITREERQRAEPMDNAGTAAAQHHAQPDETKTANSESTSVFNDQLPSPSRRRSTISRIGSAIGSSFGRKSSKAGEASPKASGGEVHLQAGQV